MGANPGERNGNPLQYSCLGNLKDRETWWATVHGIPRVGHDLMSEKQQKQLVHFGVQQKLTQHRKAIIHQ